MTQLKSSVPAGTPPQATQQAKPMQDGAGATIPMQHRPPTVPPPPLAAGMANPNGLINDNPDLVIAKEKCVREAGGTRIVVIGKAYVDFQNNAGVNKANNHAFEFGLSGTVYIKNSSVVMPADPDTFDCLQTACPGCAWRQDVLVGNL